MNIFGYSKYLSTNIGYSYEYAKFEFSNIFIFIFDQKLSFVKGEYSNKFRYWNICLRILGIQIQISEIWLFKYIRIHLRSRNQYSPISELHVCEWVGLSHLFLSPYAKDACFHTQMSFDPLHTGCLSPTLSLYNGRIDPLGKHTFFWKYKI